MYIFSKILNLKVHITYIYSIYTINMQKSHKSIHHKTTEDDRRHQLAKLKLEDKN